MRSSGISRYVTRVLGTVAVAALLLGSVAAPASAAASGARASQTSYSTTGHGV